MCSDERDIERLWIRVLGRVPSKSNTYRIVQRRGGGARLKKDDAVVAYERTVAERCRELAQGRELPLYPLPVKLELWLIWHREAHDGRRRDLDNIYKAVKDGLTQGGAWADDSQVTTHYATIRYDAAKEGEWLDIVIQPDAEQPRSAPRRKGSTRAA